MSFLLPTARCDLLLSSSDMGLLTASIFLGDLTFNKSVVFFSFDDPLFQSFYKHGWSALLKTDVYYHLLTVVYLLSRNDGGRLLVGILG